MRNTALILSFDSVKYFYFLFIFRRLQRVWFVNDGRDSVRYSQWIGLWLKHQKLEERGRSRQLCGSIFFSQVFVLLLITLFN